MKRLLVFLLMSIILSSCSLFPDQRISFTFTNSLDSTIQLVSIHPIHNPELKVSSTVIAGGQSTTLVLDMQKATKCDGCYVIEVLVEEITTSVEHGYYSNGFPLEERVSIVINDEFLDGDH